MNIEEYAKKHPKSKGAILSPSIIKKIEKLPKGSKILDIGCAEGYTVKYLYDIFGKKYNYVGVDLSENRIERAKKLNIPNSLFIVSNGENIKLNSNSFDCVLCSQVLEHVKNEENLLSEIKRLLKKDGIYQIDTVFKKKWAWYFYKAPIGWALDPTHLREYTDIGVVENMFRKIGLKVEEIYLRQSYRDLNRTGSVNLEIPILGYYLLFIEGKN